MTVLHAGGKFGGEGYKVSGDLHGVGISNEYLEFNPQVADAILEKAIQAFKAAEAARHARELVRRKSVLESSPLPGKLADCSSRDPEECEIYLVDVLIRDAPYTHIRRV